MTDLLTSGPVPVRMDQVQRWARARGATAEFVDEVIPALFDAGARTSVRPDVLVAQAAHETGFGRFGRALTPSHHNTCGLKIPHPVGPDDNPGDHERFDSWEQGAEAHANHLRWPYAGLDPIGFVAPRSHRTATAPWAGTIATVEGLSEHWAPSSTYHEPILRNLSEMASSSEHRIILREEWGAVHERGAGPAPLPATEVWLHHTVTIAPDLEPPFDDDFAAIRRLERIGEDRFGRGISYTFCITPVGLIFEGHGIERRGAHTYGHNVDGRAIAFVGNYEEHPPTGAMIDAAGWLLAHGYLSGWWTAAKLKGGHRDVRATSCPGRYAYAAMPDIDAAAAAYASGAGQLPAHYPEEDEMSDAIRALYAAARSSRERRYDVVLEDPPGFIHWQAVAEKAGSDWRKVLNDTLVKDLRREKPDRKIPDLPIV